MSRFLAPSIPDGISAEYTALCPLDGRYAQIGRKLAPYFSEYALVRNRVWAEVHYLKFLFENVTDPVILKLKDKFNGSLGKIMHIYYGFDEDSFARIKEIEAVTNHDVKAVELFIGEELRKIGCEEFISFVHIGCTSEDINNTAYAAMISGGLYDVWLPAAQKLVEMISNMALEYVDIPMLAHTHGQPATPTMVGKELAVYVSRLNEALANVKSIPIRAKFNGATGTYAAISTAFPYEDWQKNSKLFIENYLRIEFNPVTTQIEGHDYFCHIADGIRHFNNVLLDFDLDMWQYISMMYLKQIPVATEVGSSTMPHKINPIRFENSEANIDISNALLTALSNKLSRSRMQRDLSDSSSQRNIGIAFGYSLQAIEQTIGGLKKVSVNTEKISSELNDNWEVLAEPIQTMLRKYGIQDAYDQLKKLTRGKSITKEIIQEFVKSLDVLSDEDKEVLLALTPSSYVGLAEKITRDFLEN